MIQAFRLSVRQTFHLHLAELTSFLMVSQGGKKKEEEEEKKGSRASINPSAARAHTKSTQDTLFGWQTQAVVIQRKSNLWRRRRRRTLKFNAALQSTLSSRTQTHWQLYFFPPRLALHNHINRIQIFPPTKQHPSRLIRLNVKIISPDWGRRVKRVICFPP